MKSIKLIGGLLGVVALVLLVSCSSTSSTLQVAEMNGGGKVAPTITAAPAPATRTNTLGGSGSYSQDSSGEYYNGIAMTPSTDDRMIVRTGNMSIVVEDVTFAINRIAGLAEGSQGYVVSSNSWRDNERLSGTITIRIPAEGFSSIMKQVGDMAVEVTNQTTTAQDVTEEYVDLTAKLKTLEATEQQLLTIMAKADKVEDILAVQKQLTDTQTEIEQTKGRMQYLEKTSAMSLITVNLTQSKLDATFNAERRFIKSGQSVTFYPQVAGGFTPYSYQWDFGDGKTSNEESPVHAYNGTKDYTVTLVVTDDKGNTDNATMKDYIHVAGGWSPGNIAGGAWHGLAAFGRALLNIIIWLGIFSPVWLIIGGIIFWLVRRSKKA
jgi:PKD repeat protein